MDTQAREHGQSNFSLPHDVVPLPTNGFFYKNKKKAIKVGYLTANDENILMAGGTDMTQTLLRSKIYEPDIRIEDLLEGDVESILIFLRNTAFGPEMEMNLVDPVTKKPFKSTVRLDELNVIKGQQPLDDGTFITSLPKSQTTVKLKPMTYGEILDVQKMAESYPQGRTAPKVTWRLNKQIVEINGVTDRSEISKFIDQMPIADSKYIRKFMDENEPKLDLTRTVMAPSGEKLTVNVGFGVDFFRPFF
jgi:hypothetical protein